MPLCVQLFLYLLHFWQAGSYSGDTSDEAERIGRSLSARLSDDEGFSSSDDVRLSQLIPSFSEGRSLSTRLNVMAKARALAEG